MGDKRRMYEKVKGNRIPLYAEVGKYFLPDGSFDEKAFRESLRESLKRRESQPGPLPTINEWMIDYLTEILEYLSEKNITDLSFRLFRIALDESSRNGLDRVNIPARQLMEILDHASPDESLPERRMSTVEKRDAIFDAAVRVFAEKGFHSATMDEIAALAGIGKGSIYRHFKSKNELLTRLLEEKYREIIDRISGIFSSERDVLSQIQEMIEVWVTFIEDNHVVYRLIQGEAISKRDGGGDMFYDYLITRLPMFKERIIAFNRDRKIKTTNFYTTFYGILGFIDGVVQKWFRSGMSYPLRDEIPIITEVLFNGFVGESRTGTRFYTPPYDHNDL